MKARKLPLGPLINPLELTVVMHSLSLGLTAFAVAAVLTAAGGSFALGQKADVPAVAQIDITEIDRDFFGFRGLWSEFVDTRGHFAPSDFHLPGWYMDVGTLHSRGEAGRNTQSSRGE